MNKIYVLWFRGYFNQHEDAWDNQTKFSITFLYVKAYEFIIPAYYMSKNKPNQKIRKFQLRYCTEFKDTRYFSRQW